MLVTQSERSGRYVQDISVGYSHNVIFQIPPNLKVTAETEKEESSIFLFQDVINKLIKVHMLQELELKENRTYKGKIIDMLMNM